MLEIAGGIVLGFLGIALISVIGYFLVYALVYAFIISLFS